MAAGAHGVEHRLAIADDMVGILQAIVAVTPADQLFEDGFALDERQCDQVVTVLLEDVEGVEFERDAGADAALQHREISPARFVDGHDLPVEQQGACGQGLERAEDDLELVGPIVAVARINSNLRARDGDLGAIAVELHLKQPVVAGRDGVAKRAKLERSECGEGIARGRF
ncbi:hypothetical protein ABIB57_004385 [Devosia sp. UYZn731]